MPFDVISTLDSALSQWFETGTVCSEAFTEKFQNALNAQTLIGWRHFFALQMAVQCLEFLPSYFDSQNKFCEDYIWGASLVETVLHQVLELWDERNTQVKGSTAAAQEKKKRDSLGQQVLNLQAKSNQAQPGDQHLFLANPVKFIKGALLAKLSAYISTTSSAISNSRNKQRS